MPCLGLGAASFSQQAEQGSALLCWPQRGDLCHQRGEAALLALYLPHPPLRNSTNCTPQTMSSLLSSLCPFPSQGLWSYSPWTPERSAQWPAGCLSLQQGQQGVGAPRACHSRRVMGLSDSLLTLGDKRVVSLMYTHQIRGSTPRLPSHLQPSPLLPAQHACCGYCFLLLSHRGLVGWGWELECGLN